MGVLLAIYGYKVSIAEALFISAFAMIVVFAVLLVISYLIDFTAIIVATKKKNNDKLNTNNDIKSNIETNVYDDKLIAVIAGVVAAYIGTNVDNIKIKNIRRVNQSDSLWLKSGLFDHINKYN